MSEPAIPIESPGNIYRQGVTGAARFNLPAKGASPEALKRVARDFESLLLGALMEQMKNTIPDSGLFDSPIYNRLSAQAGPPAEAPTLEQLR